LSPLCLTRSPKKNSPKRLTNPFPRPYGNTASPNRPGERCSGADTGSTFDRRAVVGPAASHATGRNEGRCLMSKTATVRTPTTKGFARWSDRHACGTQPNVINCMVSCPVSPFAQRVLVPLLGAITGGAWHLGRGSVTTEVKLCSNRKASKSTRSTFP
jgi:hypothetical protein